MSKSWKMVVCIALVALLTLTVVNARLPVKGDHVQIAQAISPTSVFIYVGSIIDVGDGFLCLNCTEIWPAAGYYIGTDNVSGEHYIGPVLLGRTDLNLDRPVDMCIVIDSIRALVWI
jgi:hypothetical protein